jgi:hypothetical protein
LPPIQLPTLVPDAPACRERPGSVLTDAIIRIEVTSMEIEDDDEGEEIHLGLPRELEHSETPGIDYEGVPLVEVGRRWEVGDWAQVRWDADPDSEELEYVANGRTIRLHPGFTFRVAGPPDVPLPGVDQLYVAFRMPRPIDGRAEGAEPQLYDISTELIGPVCDPAGDECRCERSAGAGAMPPALPSDVVIPAATYFGFARRVASLHAQMAASHHRAVALGLRELAEEMIGKAVSL